MFLWGAIILNLVFVGIYILAFNGVKSQTEKTSISINALREYRESGENIALVKKILQSTKEGDALLGDYVVLADGVVSFIETVESLGKMAGVSLTLSALRDERNTLIFSVQTKGSFRNNMYFMTLMENLPFLLETTHSSLTKQSENKDGSRLVGVWSGVHTFELHGFIGK